MLIGIVKKNGIMLVDFALQAEQNEGLSTEESIYQACIKRFRPILMTTMAALLGAVPMMIRHRSRLRDPPAARLRHRPAASPSHRFSTLYTTPVVYIYLDRLQSRLFGHRTQAASGTAAPAPAGMIAA